MYMYNIWDINMMNEIHALQAGHANNALTGVLLPSVEQDSHYQPFTNIYDQNKGLSLFLNIAHKNIKEDRR